jgi:putative spermidine/putrescine transport system substrate-binding protein
VKTFKILSIAVVAAGLTLPAAGVSAGEITVMSWGGAYTKSQVEAYHKPWMAKTGASGLPILAPMAQP